MASMFDNYENLNADYIPNNSEDPKFSNYTITNNTLPRHVYNAKGELVGISWKQGENISIRFTVDDVLFVESSSIILTVSGQTPQASLTTEQLAQVVKGTRCYNTVDAKSWTCTSLDTITREWQQDTVLTTPDNGIQKTFFNSVFSSESLINYDINLYNFRFDSVLHSVPNTGDRYVDFTLSSEKSSTLLPDNYRLVVSATQGNTCRIIYNQLVIIQ